MQFTRREQFGLKTGDSQGRSEGGKGRESPREAERKEIGGKGSYDAGVGRAIRRMGRKQPACMRPKRQRPQKYKHNNIYFLLSIFI